MLGRTGWVLGLSALLAAGAAADTARPVPVYVDGSRLSQNALLIQQRARTILPMRTLFESLGARVEWDSTERAVYAWKPDGVGVRLPLNAELAQTMRMNRNPAPGHWGEVTGQYRLSAPATLVETRVYVPLRFAAEALHADVRFAEQEPAVHIRTQRVAGEPEPDTQGSPSTSERGRAPERDRESAQERERQARRDRDAERERRRAAAAREAERAREAAPRLDDALDVRLSLRTHRLPRNRIANLTLVVRNRSDGEVRVPFASEQQYDFEVRKDAQVLWQWGRGRTFSQAGTTLVLQPDEEVTFEVPWDLRNQEGEPLPPGDYRVRAFLTPTLDSARLSAERSVRILR